MKTKYKILLIITPAVFILDQLTKWLVVSSLALGDRVPVIPGLFDIVYYLNEGAAFGLFSGLPDSFRLPFFYVVAVLAVFLLTYLYKTLEEGERLMSVAVALVFGGIAGNIVDRIRLEAVIDFLSFHIGDLVLEGTAFGIRYRLPMEWPAFNIADSAITVAVLLIIISAVRSRRQGD